MSLSVHSQTQQRDEATRAQTLSADAAKLSGELEALRTRAGAFCQLLALLTRVSAGLAMSPDDAARLCCRCCISRSSLLLL